jgi:hypothetical protein
MLSLSFSQQRSLAQQLPNLCVDIGDGLRIMGRRLLRTGESASGSGLLDLVKGINGSLVVWDISGWTMVLTREKIRLPSLVGTGNI